MLPMMYTVTHVMPMPGGLVQNSPGGGRMDKGGFLQGLSCEWGKLMIAPTLALSISFKYLWLVVI